MKLTELLEKITKLPWVRTGVVQGTFMLEKEQRTNPHFAVIKFTNLADIRNDKANAAYLTHCANVLPELVKSLERLAHKSQAYCNCPRSWPRAGHHDDGCAYEIARKALAKAEEVPQ